MAADAPIGIGPHVRAHQAAHEAHRHDRRDDRERRQDRRVAHLVDRLDGDGRERATARGGSLRWRTMFSTTTIASSTRIPIEKMRAKSVMRFSV